VTGKHGVKDNGRPDQGKRDEKETNFRACEILGRDRAELRADSGPGIHHQCDQNIDVAFDGVGKSAVAG